MMQVSEATLREVAIILALIVVLIAVILTASVIYRTKRITIARDLILNHLKDKGFTMISFERIRSNIKQDYSDQFLEKLPEYFPNELRRARLKDKGGDLRKPGLAMIRRERQPVEEGPNEASAG